MKPSTSRFVNVRGLRYHVRTWGDPRARKLILLHGWMDVSASFQFLVDALASEWHVLAPDWRGFGLSESPPHGYWFADYVADLDCLVRVLAGDDEVDIVGHSLGGNVALLYAGVRPGRVKKVVSLEGFGIPGECADVAPKKFAAWLDALEHPAVLAPYRNLAAVADRLQKNNRRLPRDKAEFLAVFWGEVLPDGTARLRADPNHKRPFPNVYRLEEAFAIWRQITAPVLWVVGEDSDIPRWLAGGGDAMAEIQSRCARVPQSTLVSIADAGHMLHHDQPQAVARSLEAFL
ncbi:MAG: alpha/beta hydrolase [Betaproteobacteria bacterium]